eukprot:1393047-Karenia_brevis.AAC.1
MEGVGYTPTVVGKLRTMCADAVAGTRQGRCLITAITVAKGIKWDPWVMGPVNTIIQFMGGRCGEAVEYILMGSGPCTKPLGK